MQILAAACCSSERFGRVLCHEILDFMHQVLNLKVVGKGCMECLAVGHIVGAD